MSPSPHDDESLAFDLPARQGRGTPTGYLLDALRQRPVGNRLLSGLVAVLFASGIGMFVYPFVTDVYTDTIVQDRLAAEFERTTLAVDTFDEWQSSVQGQTGAAVTRIVIDDIDMQTLVVEGTSAAALRAGAGHYPSSPLPGQIGNVGIAGHRTTYGRPFNRLDELDAGSVIWLVTPVGDHRYEVVPEPASDECAPTATSDRPDAAACITNPRDWGVVQQPGEERASGFTEGADAGYLTLTTCHPKGSAAQRLVIRAKLVESLPAGTWQSMQADEA